MSEFQNQKNLVRGLHKELDAAIVINESIRMTKKYGSVEGYKLVNAVLDKIIKAS